MIVMPAKKLKPKRNWLPYLIGLIYLGYELLKPKKANAGMSEITSQQPNSYGQYFKDYRNMPNTTYAIFNNNPQNIIKTNIKWAGEDPNNNTPYERFINMYYGWRAAILNADANVPYTERTTESLLRRLHVGSGNYTDAARAANKWVMAEMKKQGADPDIVVPTIKEAGNDYSFTWWWAFHRNNARLEAGNHYTYLIDQSSGDFVNAFNDVLIEKLRK